MPKDQTSNPYSPPTGPGASAAIAKEIFLEALAKPGPEARASYLAEVCGPDAALRARVDLLLEASAEAADFLTASVMLDVDPDLAREAGLGGEPELAEKIGYFGDYVLLDEIARGSSGVVFRARQTSLNRIVALKMPRDHTLAAGSEGMKRFNAEVKAVAALDHPNIVPIYEVGEHEGQGYFSMKLIGEGTLHTRAGQFREPKKAVRLIIKVARAVEAAHARGLLHRDIKPGNILLDAEGGPHLTDFGVARRMGEASDLTLTGQIMGTPYYMAPEQARGEARTLTPAADVYSLGAVLYELLGRERPITGDSMIEVLRHAVELAPKPLRALNPALDRDLECIVMKCLEKPPAARYGTATALADDLERWLRREPIAARPAGQWRRAVKWLRRRPYRGVVLLLAAGLAVTLTDLILLRKERPPLPKALTQEELAATWVNWVPVPPGQPLDVISLIYLDRGPASNWAREKDSLTAFAGPPEKVQSLFFPIHATGDYDLRLEFTLRDLRNGINEVPLLQFTVGSRLMQLELAAASGCRCPKCVPGGTAVPLDAGAGISHPFGPVSGLQWIRHRSIRQNGTALFHHDLAAGVPHTLAIRVRVTGKTGSVATVLDEKPFLNWSGPLAALRETDPVKDGFGDGGGLSYFRFMNPTSYTVTYNRLTLTPLKGGAWRREPN
ncbi:MAG: serine/threonine-protein kinase [Verrucomicrobiota bacterium]